MNMVNGLAAHQGDGDVDLHEVRDLVIDEDTTWETIARYACMANGTNATTIKIDRECNFDVSSDLAEIIYSANSLETLSIISTGSLHSDFWNKLKEHAANIQAEKLILGPIHDLTQSNASDLAEILSLMPNLVDQVLFDYQCTTLDDGFFSTLKEKAKDLRIETFKLSSPEGVDKSPMTSSAEEDLAEALSLMPYLENLTLELILQQPLFRKMYHRALSVENAFPQVASGNFFFNGQRQMDMASFRCTLDYYEDPEDETDSHSESEDNYMYMPEDDLDWQPESEDDDM